MWVATGAVIGAYMVTATIGIWVTVGVGIGTAVGTASGAGHLSTGNDMEDESETDWENAGAVVDHRLWEFASRN